LHPLTALQEALDLGEITSTTTGLNLDSESESSASHSDDDMNTTIDVADSRAIRRQLEGLETMYSSVISSLHYSIQSINRIVAGAEGVEQEDDPLGRRRLQNVETADVRKRFFAAQFRVQPAGLPRPPEE